LEDREVKQRRQPENDVEISAPKYLDKTTCQSRTGAVINGSIVPSLNSSANSRIVISGKMRTKANQKKTELKKASWTE
jgi:hypothetical protein